MFKGMGIDYGPSYRTIEEVHIGTHEALAKLVLPPQVVETKNTYDLHPSLMDAALQASMLFMNDFNHKSALLSSLDRLEILKPCGESMWVWVRYSSDGLSSDSAQKLDIDLCDQAGRVCVQMQGLRFGDGIAAESETETQYRWVFSSHDKIKELESNGFSFVAEEKVSFFLKQLIADQLYKPINAIDMEAAYFELGLTSSGLVKLAAEISNKINGTFDANKLFKYTTPFTLSSYLLKRYPAEIDRLAVTRKRVDAKVAFGGVNQQKTGLVSYNKGRKIVSGKRSNLSQPSSQNISAHKRKPLKNHFSLSSQKRFPELIRLNESVEGRPVFWFHAALGGVDVYSGIAQVSQRPFYGIEARGYRTKRSPLHGVQAMAAYYIQVLQSVLAEGPYDLGGYSLGGTLAYEVARQLQELGHTVDTIIMLDSFDSFPKAAGPSYKTTVLQAANGLLMSWMMLDSKKSIEKLIHREELDLTFNDKEILNQVCRMVQERGLKMAEAELIKSIHKKVR